jgi:hypothetical protein
MENNMVIFLVGLGLVCLFFPPFLGFVLGIGAIIAVKYIFLGILKSMS